MPSQGGARSRSPQGRSAASPSPRVPPDAEAGQQYAQLNVANTWTAKQTFGEGIEIAPGAEAHRQRLARLQGELGRLRATNGKPVGSPDPAA